MLLGHLAHMRRIPTRRAPGLLMLHNKTAATPEAGRRELLRPGTGIAYRSVVRPNPLRTARHIAPRHIALPCTTGRP